MKSFKIGNFLFNKKSSPYLIAEISSNHMGSLNQTLKLIKNIKESGAHAIKLQTYTEDTMTINSRKKEFLIKDGIWKNYNLYKLYSEAKTPWSWYDQIFKYCKKLKITCFSTPFDETSVNFLEKYNVPAYKIASYEIVDLPLIKYVAKKNKPVILSTGMANLSEIDMAIKTVKKTGNNKIIVLHCVTKYPSDHSDYNLLTMQELSKKFGVYVGLSDHTEGSITPIIAAGLGAKVIEKHVKLKNDNKSHDSKFSYKVNDLKKLSEKIKKAWECRGVIDFKKSQERKQTKFRRSIYVVQDIKENQKLTKKNIKRIRPGLGLNPIFYEKILGRKVKKDIKFGTPLKLNDIL
jgi:pseudaminic acid synthase